MNYRIIKVLSTSRSNPKWSYKIQSKVQVLGFWKTVQHKEGPLSHDMVFDSYESAEDKILHFCKDGELISDGNIYKFKKYTYYV